MKFTKTSLRGKLIDLHTHAGVSLNAFFDDKYPYCYSAIEISRNIRCIGFDAACVFPFPAFLCGDNLPIGDKEKAVLRELMEEVPYKKATEKILLEKERFELDNIMPFAMFSINYAIKEQIEFLEEVSSKIYGLKYYPDADTKKISDLMNEGRPFIDYLLKHNMPLVIHASENACLFESGYSNVMDAIELAKAIPGLRVAVAHMGHFSKKAMESVLSNRPDNFYYDVSPLLHICHIRTVNAGDVYDIDYSDPEVVMKELLNLFPDKILWGSDMPFNFTCNLRNSEHNFEYEQFSIENNFNILKKMGAENMTRMCSENTLDFLFGK